MKNKLENLKKEILGKLQDVKNKDLLRDLEVEYLGRKGKLTAVLRSLKELSVEEKKKIGQLANEIKRDIQVQFREAQNILSGEKKNSFIDVTMPAKDLPRGHLSPLTIVQNELEDLFTSMGFIVEDGPLLESDYFCFEALNVSKHHPARDMQDTFYVEKRNKEGENDLVMRTQTSPVQVRAMKKYGAPLKIIVPGRCFRSEATDVRHEHTFYQLEGLMIGEGISFGHMKGVLEVVGKKLYGPDTKLRNRPKFYPFVEPGVNGEYTCFLCKGKGCKLCKKTGWLEVFGAGMVHPNVLKAGGIDPKKYSGFAFGFGLDRLTMLKYGIDDVRLFNSGDLRFLNQF